MTGLGEKAKVLFDYDARENEDLTLRKGDIVHILGEVSEYWLKGQLGNKIGVFPSNYVGLFEDGVPVEAEHAISGLL